jgi:hypothetical protein
MKANALPRALFFAGGLFVAALTFAADARAQNPSATPTENKVTADENFDLNITESRTTETNYERSTSIEINNASVSVGVGAAVRAQRIDILLRGVTGTVRFRASLERLRRRVEQTAPARPQPPNQEN